MKSLYKSFGSITKKLSMMFFLLFAIKNLHAQVDFKQAANKNPTLGSVNWINSILQQTKSVYYEGMAVPQRVFLKDLAPGTHTLKINHQSLKNSASRHAYDFLTSWDKAKQAAQEINTNNPLFADLFTNACANNIPASMVGACGSRAFNAAVNIPSPPNPSGSPGFGVVSTKKAMFDAQIPAQQGNLMI